MLYYLFLIMLIAIFCYVEYDDKKKRFTQAKQLKYQFDEWLINDEAPRPSNAIFKKLYKECYKEDTHALPVYSGNRAIIMKEIVDVVMSFPTKHPKVIATQLQLLDNLESHFEEQYQATCSIGYYLKYIASLPLKLVNYLGLDDNQTAGKLLKFLIWFIGLFLPQLKELVLAFIDFLITKQG